MLTVTYGFDPTEAACYGQDVNTFFPNGQTGRRRKGEAPMNRDAMERLVAAQFCGRCKVRQACLDLVLHHEAVDGHASDGVWGGLTKQDRLALREDVSEVA